tara:strand:- start:746 stop:1393 length:648 start_codon:yes stop_codon:yes gene_type:complete
VFKKFKDGRAKKRQDRTASEVLEEAARTYQSKEKDDTVTIDELMHVMHERGFGLLLIIFVLPNCIPIPAPGLVSLTAFPLYFIAWQLFIGQEYPWLPKFIGRRKIRRTLLADIVARATPVMRKVEKLMRPRLSFAASDTGERIIGACCLLFTTCIAIPLPWTNFIPGWGIMIMSLGLLSRDGVMILLGLLTGFVGTILTGIVVLFGSHIIHQFLG